MTSLTASRAGKGDQHHLPGPQLKLSALIWEKAKNSVILIWEKAEDSVGEWNLRGPQ